MYKSYLIKTGLFLAVVACIIVSCKKDKEVTETTPVCKIIVPAVSELLDRSVDALLVEEVKTISEKCEFARFYWNRNEFFYKRGADW